MTIAFALSMQGANTPYSQYVSYSSYLPIPSVAIYDRDVEHGHTHSSDEFYTAELCFEVEIVKSLYAAGKLDIIKQIALDIDNRVSSMVLETNLIKGPFKKMGISIDGYAPKKLSEVDDGNADEFCNMYSAWYMVKKGILLGRIVGDAVSAAKCPPFIQQCNSASSGGGAKCLIQILQTLEIKSPHNMKATNASWK